MLADQGLIAPEDVGRAAPDDGARGLWVGVLRQAVLDAGQPARGCSRSYPTPAVVEARRWLTGAAKPGTLALALAALDIDQDTWRGRCLPRLLARWRAADAGLGPVQRHGRRPGREARHEPVRARPQSGQPMPGEAHPGAS